MKELYTSPEVKLINFLAQEDLATEDIEITTSGVVPNLDTDISLDLNLFL